MYKFLCGTCVVQAAQRRRGSPVCACMCVLVCACVCGGVQVCSRSLVVYHGINIKGKNAVKWCFNICQRHKSKPLCQNWNIQYSSLCVSFGFTNFIIWNSFMVCWAVFSWWNVTSYTFCRNVSLSSDVFHLIQSYCLAEMGQNRCFASPSKSLVFVLKSWLKSKVLNFEFQVLNKLLALF